MEQTTNRMDEPIYTPPHAGPDYPLEPDYDKPLSPALRAARFVADLARVPAHWIRQNIVEPNKGPKYYWYHRKFNRALPIDECYADDTACIHEANLEYHRLRLVDRATLELLRYRRDSCIYWNFTKEGMLHASDKCKDLDDTYNREEMNFFIKYGDQRFGHTVMDAYMKQKHRLIMERRRATRKEIGDLPEERP